MKADQHAPLTPRIFADGSADSVRHADEEEAARNGVQALRPRLPHQPIFSPVLNEEYATEIARDWNVPAPGSGYVTRFEEVTRPRHCAASYPQSVEKPLQSWDNHPLTSADDPRPQ
ncbi:hypothetical protein [Actinomadura formosensis]|uniref:hypothetical protein n=1 Tax=Actinomadura formosensis TaxID=60706 RepID=UPI001F5F6DFE|nr:hypothetical protein [Actinomadura formosensis]